VIARRFKGLTIGIRLSLGFGVVFVLFCALTLFVINRMQYLADSASQIHKHPLTVSNAVLRIDSNIVKIHRSMKDIVLDKTAAEINRDSRLVDNHERKTYSDFDIINKRFLGAKALYETARGLFVAWKPIRNEVIALMHAGKKDEAMRITKGKGALHVLKIEHAIAALNTFAQAKADEFVANARETADQSIRTMYLLLSLLVAAMVLFTIYLTRSITRPVSALRAAAFEMGHGRLDTPLNIEAGGEMGDLARSFREMADNLSRVTASRDELNQEIIERKKIEESLHLMQDQLKSLLDASRTLNTTLDQTGIRKILLDASRSLTNSTSALVGLVEDGRIVFREHSHGDQYDPVDYTFEPGYGVPGHVMQTLKPYISNDAEHDAHTIPKIIRELNVHQLLDVPILNRSGKQLGCFEVHNRKDGRPFDDTDAKLLEGLAASAAVALENASLFDERKLAEEQLIEQRKSMQIILDNAPVGIWRLSEDKRIKFINPTFCNAVGVEERRFLDTEHYSKLLSEDVSKSCMASDTVCFETRAQTFDIEDIPCVDGKVHSFEIIKTPILDEEGVMQGLVGMANDITKRKAAERAQRKLMANLEGKTAEMERFVYTVSHDLKSPLITIQGFLGLLEKDATAGETERLHGDVSQIQKAAHQMQELLADLLEISRIGRLVNPPENVAFNELAQETVALLAGQIKEYGAEIDIAPDQPTLFGDRKRLLEVMQNLIGNALKFMGEQATPLIEIGSRREKGENICYVRDNGIGIEPRFHKKVFGLFERLDPAVEGTGIGLAIVKRIIELEGGRIWVESEGEGKGSTFCFVLPGEELKIKN